MELRETPERGKLARAPSLYAGNGRAFPPSPTSRQAISTAPRKLSSFLPTLFVHFLWCTFKKVA